MQLDFFNKITSFFKEKGTDTLRERRVLLVCMGLSLMVWFFVKMSQTYESNGQLTLSFQIPVGQVFSEKPLRAMPFKFAGTGWQLLRTAVFREQPSLDFKLSGAATQVISRTDISRKIEESLRLRLVELGQDNVAIQLDSLFSKKVEIELDTAISFSNGYFFREAITLSPDSVVIFGAPALLSKINSVKTELLDMECPEADFSKTLELVNPDPSLLTFSNSQTAMRMAVEQFTEKTLTVPVMVLNERDSVRLLPGTVELRCVVGISRYQSVSPTDFRVVAVIGNDDAVSTVPLALVRQPDWVKSARLSPQVVEYLIVQ